MNYEQKYKEAIESIKRIYNQADSYGKELMEKEFPDLTESKDERIRKEIIELVHFFYCSSSVYEHHVSEDDMIAWLEKQGEKTIPKNIDDAALQYVDTCAFDGMVTHDNINEPYWSNHSMTVAYKAGWLEKQDEKKPEKTSIWKHWSGNGIAGNGEGKQTFLINQNGHYSISSCLGFECDYIELSELNKLMQGEQNSAEWSEEDDRRLNHLIGFIQKYGFEYYSSIDKVIDWLKSLKSKIH